MIRNRIECLCLNGRHEERYDFQASHGLLFAVQTRLVSSLQCAVAQGFQMLVDQQSGFGSVAVDVLTALRDDYGSAPVLLFGVQSVPDPPSITSQVSITACNACAWIDCRLLRVHY